MDLVLLNMRGFEKWNERMVQGSRTDEISKQYTKKLNRTAGFYTHR